jgi:hypothetical protein
MGLPIRAAVLGLVAATTMSPRTAAADPVAITNGYFTAGTVDTSAQAMLNGDGFGLNAFIEAYISTLSLSCTPCAPGTTLDLGGSFEGPRASGSAFVDGVTYSEVFLDGMTGTFSSPAFVISGTDSVRVTRPFTFSAVVSGYLLDPFVYGITQPAFTKTLSGTGVASATFLFNDDETPLFFGTGLRYDFTNPGATPEPATLLLVATGVAIGALGRRRGRSVRI